MKNQLIKGTLILCVAGIITRIMGFYYKIFLSNTIGAKNLGIYQMFFPIYGLFYSFAISGIQTSISRFTAMKNAKNDISGAYIFFSSGLFISLSLSIFSSLILYFFSDFIAINIIDEPECSKILKYSGIGIVFSCFHSCISGFFMGCKKVHIPAITQLAEQLSRIAIVFLISKSLPNSILPDAGLAIAGLIFGELCSAIMSLIYILCDDDASVCKKNKRPLETLNTSAIREIFIMAYPLSLNRVISSIFATVEAILIPICLKQYGLCSDDAFSLYGIFTGMAMPLILFPSTITNSLASVIIPSIAESQSRRDYERIRRLSSKVCFYCVLVGMSFTILYYSFGGRLGEFLFNNSQAGIYISILSWLCPFLYTCTTVGGILNGLGLTKKTFIHNLISTSVRIISILLFMPCIGMPACLYAILVSYIVCTVLHINALYRYLSGKC